MSLPFLKHLLLKHPPPNHARNAGRPQDCRVILAAQSCLTLKSNCLETSERAHTRWTTGDQSSCLGAAELLHDCQNFILAHDQQFFVID